MESLSWTLSLSSTGLCRLTLCLFLDRAPLFAVTSDRVLECPGLVRGLSSRVSVRDDVFA